MRPKAIFRQGYLTPVPYRISFHNMETKCAFLLKFGCLAYFEALNAKNYMNLSENTPKAISRMGYLVPVPYCLSFQNLETKCALLSQFNIFTYCESLIMKSSMSTSKTAIKLFIGSAGITYVQFYVQDLKLMLLHTLKS